MQGSRDLPPLDLLRGFEAAARHLSFTLAAKELFLTQSAISRQVKTLEEALGVPLFERRHRELRLTEAGETLHKTVAEVLRMLRDAAERVAAPRDHRALNVATTISFTSLWLIPRLAAFQRAHPDIDVRISARNAIQNLDRDGIDVAIRYSPAELAGPGAVRLFGEQVMPVASPRLVGKRLAHAKDLLGFMLLHYDDREYAFPWLAWDVWLETFGVELPRDARRLRLSNYEQVIQAAVEGEGIALGRWPLVEGWLKDGRLVAPLGRRFSIETPKRAFWLVAREGARERPEVRAFSDWMQAEARPT